MDFRVLVIAAGHRSVVTDYLDPGRNALHVQLEPTPRDLPNDRILRGRVVKAEGTSVQGALVTPEGAKTMDRHWWGALPGVDAAAVSDEEGRFVITSTDPKIGLYLEVTAPGYAVRAGKLYPLNGAEQVIHLQEGVNVFGRLVFNGQPQTNRAVQIVQRDRSAGAFVGELTLATDGKGEFYFSNLQPNQDYLLYTLYSGLADEPVLKTYSLQTRSNKSDLNVGDLGLDDGVTLEGGVELPGGATMPASASLQIQQHQAWSSCELPIQPNGRFVVRGLPREVLEISVSVPGFEIDVSALIYKSIGPSRFAFRLRGDLSGIRIPLRRSKPDA